MACRVVSRAPNPYIARNAYVAVCPLRVPITRAHCVPITYAHCVPYIAPGIRLYVLRDTPINPSVSNGLPYPAYAPRLGGV